MSIVLLTIGFLLFLAIGYRFYSRFIERRYMLDDYLITPAVAFKDNIDFIPTKPFYLLGQHFSAIAAAGPIAGPIIASQQFGWLPCLLWIGLGAVFIGAVHDFSALFASVRHQGRSVSEIVKSRMGRRSWVAMMLFIWLALLYVILAFTDITAGTFVGVTQELEGRALAFNAGGAVAAASISYLLLAILMGLIQRQWNPPLWLLTIVFVPATLGVVWLGTYISTLFLLGVKTWMLLILAYCFFASLLPVSVLLQPRGYLGGFVLYMVLLTGVVGLFFGDFPVKQQAFNGWQAPGLTGALFPFLFVTIACGACSGFHGLVASGTTSKQISKESHCRPIGYGSMLLEGFVALIALVTVMIVAPDAIKGASPGKIYGDGIGRFLTVIIGSEHFQFAATFGAMAFATFIFDTLDVATRLGRYILQELFSLEARRGAILATLLTVVPPAVLLMLAGGGSYRVFWVLFGSSNQLLAALTLLAITVWLKQAGRSYQFALIPMLFVMTITVWSLSIQAGWAWRSVAASGFRIDTTFLNAIVCISLIGLAAMMVVDGVRTIAGETPAPRMKGPTAG